MRVLTVCPSLDVGGLERIAVDLANALVERGAELAFAAADGPLAAGLDPRVRRIPLRAHARGRSPLSAAETAVRLARAVRAVRPDVVHAHNVKITGVAGVGLRLAGVRRPALVGTFHGVAPGEDRAASLVLRAASEVACVSEGLAERLREAGGSHGRISVIANAVAPVAPLGAEARARIDADLDLAGRPVVAWVGRLMPVKAPGRFLEAVRLIAAEVPEAAFVIVGDGPLRPALERDAPSSVRFAGWRGDARELIARADVLVVSSDSEGLSVVTLEALSAGVPVVSTPVTGMAELLGGGGGIVAERPDPALLAGAVVSLLRDPAARGRHAEAGRRLVSRRYGLAAMVDAYEALFERVRR